MFGCIECRINPGTVKPSAIDMKRYSVRLSVVNFVCAIRHGGVAAKNAAVAKQVGIV